MNKFLLSSISLILALNLNAAVFAIVDGEDITEKDLAPMLQGFPQNFDIEQLPVENKKDLIDRAIQLKLLTKKAIKEGIENDKIFKEELEIAKNTIALRAWQFKEFQKVNVEYKEIQDFYNRNKDKFIEPETFHVKHILVKEEKDAKDIINSFKDVKPEELNDKFSKVAKEKSIEPGAKESGGDLGYVEPSALVKSFADAAKSLKKNEYSKTPVKTDFGYHVILKLDDKKQKQLELNDVKAYITDLLKKDKFKIQVDKLSKELQSKSKVEYKINLEEKSKPKTK